MRSPLSRALLPCLLFVLVAGPLAAALPGASDEARAPGPFDRDATTPGERVRAEVRAAAAALGLTPTPLPDLPCPSLDAAVRAHHVQYRLAPPRATPSLDEPALEAAIACVLDAQLRADEARDRALAAAGTTLQDWAHVLGSEDPAFHDDAPTFDLRIALGAMDLLATRLDRLIAVIEARDVAPPIASDLPTAPPEIDLDPVLAVDRLGPTLYDRDYALIVDMAGDDLYDNNAGGGMIAFGGGPFIPPTGNESTWQHPIAPLGQDAPHVIVGGQFEDAEAIVSAAVALDTDGDDTYGVYREPGRDGFCTDEPIVRRVVTQGAAVAGPAILMDTAGDNDLRARVIAQGNGHVGGVGVLYLGPGDDNLTAVRSVQGSGVFGGVGIVVNEGGDDRYTARVPEGGTFNADLGFCDTTSRYAQGSGFGRGTGIASGVYGMLRDEAGNDSYRTDLKGQGFGMVFGIGKLVDLDGHDTYSADTKSMGYAEGHPSTGGPGLAFFYDERGDDVYLLDHGPGIGMGGGADPGDVPEPYMPPTLWINDVVANVVDPLLLTGAALFWERAGADTYTLAERADGKLDARGGTVGVFVDEE